MSGGTLDSLKTLLHFTYGAFTLFGVTFQRSSVMDLSPKECPQPQMQASGLGSFHFARRYFGNRGFFLFLRVLRCFSSPGSLLHTYVFSMGYLSITSGAFPHSDIRGSTVVCTSPQLFAAYHVLRRLLLPRHSPCALLCLTFRLSLPAPAALRFAFCGAHVL